MKSNIIKDKSKLFAIRIINLYKDLQTIKENMLYPNKFKEQELALVPMSMKLYAQSQRKNFYPKCTYHTKFNNEFLIPNSYGRD